MDGGEENFPVFSNSEVDGDFALLSWPLFNTSDPKVEYLINVTPTADEHFKHWRYENYNFTLAYSTSPFLVRSKKRDSDGPTHTSLFNLYLDEPNESWSTQIDGFDYLILSERPLVHPHNRLLRAPPRHRLPLLPDP
ncbi:trichome birefringence-like [Striga asiatica]|uniref:Trichome birefringence-like n=1 Tax=Striga asiatica TaxID=4170 RepID=A0A5A7QD62_STRAF|nr:trichome birefringence-like [Striga asiatica]